MNFFGREKELEILRREEELSASSARFTIVMGRRRIGKTSLIRRNFQGRQCFIYWRKTRRKLPSAVLYKDRYRGNLVYPFMARYVLCVIF